MSQCLWWRHKSGNVTKTKKSRYLVDETLPSLQIKDIINYTSRATLKIVL